MASATSFIDLRESMLVRRMRLHAGIKQQCAGRHRLQLIGGALAEGCQFTERMLFRMRVLEVHYFIGP